MKSTEEMNDTELLREILLELKSLSKVMRQLKVEME